MYFKQGRPEGKGELGAICYKEYRITLFYVLGEEGPQKGNFAPGPKKGSGRP